MNIDNAARVAWGDNMPADKFPFAVALVGIGYALIAIAKKLDDGIQVDTSKEIRL